MKNVLIWTLLFSCGAVGGFGFSSFRLGRPPSLVLRSTDNSMSLEVVEKPEAEETKDLESLSTMQIKERLLDLLPRITGKAEEYRLVETYINALEASYIPPRTLGFLNLIMAGDWQLLFSTRLLARPRPDFRLREMVQSIQTLALGGKAVNRVVWDFASDGSVFDTSGAFAIKCNYTFSQGIRMSLNLDDRVLELARGSKLPSDFQGLVGLLHHAIPAELFDPSDHSMDTTYLDENLRIVRMTGEKFEGVRDVFMRMGSFQINPE